ncbi:MAG: hypothetical protein IJZ03_00435 [Clostridia bacterium]|nr:hypothetical protein [Clostridia bacterium]
MRNIKDYGAVGDGIALDTAAIQRAIDDGGMVYIPAGVYRIGTIYLKSNGGLHLAAGAVLKGSHDRADYNADDFCPQNDVFTAEYVTGAHLIVAVGQENITIEGRGTIDGEGHYWMNESRPSPYDSREYAPNPERPGQMIFICECKNVHVTDVNLVNGPYWHLFLHGCEDVLVCGLTIRGDRPRWTNDGIDIDCCKRVCVSNCIVDVGDDALTVRAHKAPLLHSDGICENVVVTNCVLRADRDYGIRVGVGSGIIRNCVFSNLDVEGMNTAGIGIMGYWSPESKYATTIEDIMFSNINVRGGQAIHIFTAGAEASLPNPCYVRNIKMSSLMLYQLHNSFLRGISDNILENVRLSDVTVRLPDTYGENEPVFELRNTAHVSIDRLNVIGSKADDMQKLVNVYDSTDTAIN